MNSLWTHLKSKVLSFCHKYFCDLVLAEQTHEHAVEKTGRCYKYRENNIELSVLITHDCNSQAWLKAIKNMRESITKR